MNSSLAKENGNTLKRFIKRKISYTSGLLIAFLITGSIGLGMGVTNSEPEKETINVIKSFPNVLEEQKSYVKELLIENEKNLGHAKKNSYELLRKGDFYAKTVYPSTQIFFNYGNERSGKGKNKTSEEWSGTLRDIRYRMAGYTLPKGKNPYHAGEVIAKENGYDFGNYNPDSSIYDSEYLTPYYRTDSNGNMIILAVDTVTSREYYTDINGNKYYSTTDSDGNKQIVDANGKVVILDELGDVVMESALADKGINGNIPSEGVGNLDPVLDGKDAMGHLVEGNGVYIQQATKHMDEILVSANISGLDVDIPDVNKNTTKNININVQLPNSVIATFTASALSVTGTAQIPGILPSMTLTPPPNSDSIMIDKPVFDLNINKIGDGIDSLKPGGGSSNTYNVIVNDTQIGGLGTIAAVIPNFNDKIDENIGLEKDPAIKSDGFIDNSITADSATNINKGATYYNNPNGTDNGVIAQVEVKTGEFDLDRTSSNSWNYSWNNYTGVKTITNPTDIVQGLTTGVVNDKQGFVVVTTGIGRTGQDSTFNVNRNLDTDASLTSATETNKVREFAHVNMIDGQRWIDYKANFGEHAEAAKEYTKNIVSNGNYIITEKFISYENNGIINLSGMNQSFTNQYIQMEKASGTNNTGTLLAMNNGTVNITPYVDSFDKIYGNNAVFVISAEATNKAKILVQNVMYNSGTINLSSPDSAVYVIDNSGGSINAIEAAQIAYAINKGEINVSGGNNVGILLNNIAKKSAFMTSLEGGLTIAIEKAINFEDNSNIGFYVGANKYKIDDTSISSSNINGIFKGKFNEGKENIGIYSKNGMNLTEHELTFVENTDSV